MSRLIEEQVRDLFGEYSSIVRVRTAILPGPNLSEPEIDIITVKCILDSLLIKLARQGVIDIESLRVKKVGNE